MEQEKKSGYKTAYCAVAVACAACRSLVKKKRITVVKPFDNGPEMMAACMQNEPGLFVFGKRDSDGVLIMATATFTEEAGVELSLGEGFLSELSQFPPRLLSCLLSTLITEARGKRVHLLLTAEGTPSLEDLPKEYCEKVPKKSAVILLGNPNKKMVSALKEQYGDALVKESKGEWKATLELMKSSVTNLLFAGTLQEVARFIGIPYKEAGHLLGCFGNGTNGFFVTTSSLIFEDVRNRETLELLQQLSERNIKAGILITRE